MDSRKIVLLVGALFVAAAGNDSTSFIEYPAGYALPNVVAVAATNSQDTLAWFSNYGSWVHIAAPGESVVAWERPDLVVSGINRGYNLGRVTYVSGTVGAAR